MRMELIMQKNLKIPFEIIDTSLKNHDNKNFSSL